MTVKLLLLIFSLALLNAASLAQANYRPGKKDLSWGVPANGLRLAAWTNPGADKVFAVVRNFSSQKICYCHSEFNNFTVYARKNAASVWLELKFKTPPEEIVVLSICNVRILKPNEEMPPVLMREKKNYSFSLDLREYIFPADWSGSAQVKIVQSNVYCHKTENKVGEVESQTLEIKLPFTKPD